MNNFGQTLQFIRKSKHITQEKLAQGIMSRSNLSRFEAGNYCPNYASFLELLQRLNMNLTEFLYIHNNFTLPDEDFLYAELIEAENKNDITTVKKIAQTAYDQMQEGQLEYEWLYYTSQGALHQMKQPAALTLAELQGYVKDKLIQTENWFLNDFRLLNNFLAFFETEDILYFANRSLKEFEKYEQILVKNNVHIHLLMNAGTILFERRQYAAAEVYLQRAIDYALTQNKLYQVMICECYLCLIDLQKKCNIPKAKQQLKMNLTMLENWGYHDMVDKIRKLVK